MSFLDKIAMRASLNRLQTSGIAPLGVKPIDYDTAAVPGRTSGAEILLLTDEALYFGWHDRIGGRRIPLMDIKSTEIKIAGRSVTYTVIGEGNQLLLNLLVPVARKSFVQKFESLGSNLEG